MPATAPISSATAENKMLSIAKKGEEVGRRSVFVQPAIEPKYDCDKRGKGRDEAASPHPGFSGQPLLGIVIVRP